MKAQCLLLAVIFEYSVSFSPWTLNPSRKVRRDVRIPAASSHPLDSSEDKQEPSSNTPPASIDRRRILRSPVSFFASLTLLPSQSLARGLVMFPCEPGELQNTYHFLRAGESLLESQDILSTNPLFLTNRNDDMMSNRGQDQVRKACQDLLQAHANDPSMPLPTLIVHSLAAASMDTANTAASIFRLGRDRVMPEYSFLDPRAMGGWDMTRRSETMAAVTAMDYDEAGPNGLDGRPPPNDDGTPSETLADQAVRLRQELSVLESLYSGDTILLVFRDGTSPALLSSMMAGIPYNECHELEYAPGELRLNVTMDRTLDLLRQRRESPEAMQEYQVMLAQGRQSLKDLRAGNVINRKDQRIEAERLAIEAEYNRQQEERRLVNQQRADDKQALQRQVQAEQGQSASSPQTLLASVGVLGVLGAAAALVAPNESSVSDTLASSNATTTDSAVTPPPVTPTPSRLYTSSDRPIRFQTSSSSESNGGATRPVSPELTPMVDRAALAEQAMKEYLEKDDGADEWLQSLAQMIDESDSAECDVVENGWDVANGNETSVFQ